MTILTIALICATLVILWVLKTLWGSRLFWIAALAVTIILFPLTGGLSPFALCGLVVLRLVLVSRAINAGGAR